MKKKLKLFSAIACLCLSLAMMAFGVFAALTVTYRTKGIVSYDIEDTFAEIETRVYSSSKKFDDEVQLKTYSQQAEQLTFEELDALTLTGVVQGETTHDFNKVQIKNLDKGEDYEVQNSDYKDTYSSVTSTTPPEDLELALKYQTAQGEDKGLYSFFVITKVTNKSQIPLYAYVPTEGDDKYVAPENSINYKMSASYKELTTLNSEVYIVFSMSLDDITKAIDASQFVFPVCVTKDLDGVSEDLGITNGPIISTGLNNAAIGSTLAQVPTSLETATKVNIPKMTIDEPNQIAYTSIEFNISDNLSEYVNISFSFSFICPEMNINQEICLYEYFCAEAGAVLTQEQYEAQIVPMMYTSLLFINGVFGDFSEMSPITREMGLSMSVVVDSNNFKELMTVSIPRNLLTNNVFSLVLFGSQDAMLGMMAAMVGAYGGNVYMNNLYTNANISTKMTETLTYETEIAEDNGTVRFVFVPLTFKNIPKDEEGIFLDVRTNSSIFLMLMVPGIYDNSESVFSSDSELITSATDSRLSIETSALVESSYTLLIALLDGEVGDPVTIELNCDFGVLSLFEFVKTDNGSESYYYISKINEAKLPEDGVLRLPSEHNGIAVKKIGALTSPIEICSKVTKLVVPGSFDYIGEFCFSKWPELKTVEFQGDTYLRLDMRAFSDCPNLEEVIIPSEKEIDFGSACFQNSGLKSLTVNSGYFNAEIVWKCTNLETLYFGEGVVEIVGTTHNNSDGFNVKYLHVDENNPYYKCVNNCIMDMNDNLILTCKNSQLPDTIAGFGKAAFAGLNPEKIVIPSNITIIESNTFAGCSNLKYLELPVNAILGWYHELSSLDNLKTLVLNNPTPMTIAVQNVFPSGLETIYVPDESLETYKTATNWSSYVGKIKPMSQKPSA